MQKAPVRRAALALVLAAAVLASGCGWGDDGDGGAESGQDHNAADVEFAQGMIPHHEQAIEMAELASSRARSDQVKDLAERIQAAQDPEIETMKGWLEDWDEPAEPSMDHGGSTDGGMMAEAEMVDLEGASGEAFDQLFLEMMTKHHQGAVDMAEREVSEGKFADAKELAERIIDTQQAEIEEMDELLSRI